MNDFSFLGDESLCVSEHLGDRTVEIAGRSFSVSADKFNGDLRVGDIVGVGDEQVELEDWEGETVTFRVLEEGEKVKPEFLAWARDGLSVSFGDSAVLGI